MPGIVAAVDGVGATRVEDTVDRTEQLYHNTKHCYKQLICLTLYSRGLKSSLIFAKLLSLSVHICLSYDFFYNFTVINPKNPQF